MTLPATVIFQLSATKQILTCTKKFFLGVNGRASFITSRKILSGE